MATSKINASSENVDASEAVHVGKQRSESVEMWERRPKMVPPAANASAMMCRIKAYVRYFVTASGMLNVEILNNVLGSVHQSSVYAHARSRYHIAGTY
jgi:hypothetical protein